jgi:IclR family acetate operon transcriptional repressor
MPTGEKQKPRQKGGNALRDTRIIQSLDKGLQLLEIIEQETYPVSLNTLWTRLGWDKATILRMCTTLERRGYLHRDPATKAYSLGLKIFGLYQSIMNNLDVQKTARPYLKRIERETGESTHLGFIFEKSVVFVDKVMGRDLSPINVQIGGREPLHCTALGKAYLAFIDDEEQAVYIEEPLRKYTPSSFDSLAELNRDLRETKVRGYALDNEEYVKGVRCIAAPILNRDTKPVAMIGISAPAERLPDELAEQYGIFIKERALEVSRWLGYTPSVDH